MRVVTFMGKINENETLIRIRNIIVVPIGIVLVRLGVSPIILNLVGLLSGIASAYLITSSRLELAAWFLLLSGISDVFDGTVARIRGEVNAFGAFLDSILDRYVDTSIFLGLAFFFVIENEISLVLVTFIGLLGTVVTSYAAARAASLGIHSYIGFLGRPQRVILLLVGLMFENSLATIMYVIAILANITALHRTFYYLYELKKSNNIVQ